MIDQMRLIVDTFMSGVQVGYYSWSDIDSSDLFQSEEGAAAVGSFFMSGRGV